MSANVENLLADPDVNENVRRRLWARVQIGTREECWPWTGAINGRGVGQIRIAGRGSPLARVHRLAYRLLSGDPLDPMVGVTLTCSTPACCNIAHMRLADMSPRHDYAADLADAVEAMTDANFTAEQIARVMTEQGVRPPHGDSWTAQLVAKLTPTKERI